MNLFRRKSQEQAIKSVADDLKNETDKDAELTELSAVSNPKRIDKARNDARATISEATVADVHTDTLIEQGRCPSCKARISDLLYTAVCPECGWCRQNLPAGGHCRVVLDDDEIINCDQTIAIREKQVLCIRDSHVVSRIFQERIRRIDYQWNDDALEEAKHRLHKRRSGVCSWCEKQLNNTSENLDEPDAPYQEYVAFGAFQERHTFCSIKCLVAFRSQYPVRVHRNCYETECPSCTQCIKRFDVKNFKRVRPTTS